MPINRLSQEAKNLTLSFSGRETLAVAPKRMQQRHPGSFLGHLDRKETQQLFGTENLLRNWLKIRSMPVYLFVESFCVAQLANELFF